MFKMSKTTNKKRIGEKELDKRFMIFGNKGACWSEQPHITEIGLRSTTLCGVPMLSNNWARIWELGYAGCPECIEEYEKAIKDDK